MDSSPKQQEQPREKHMFQAATNCLTWPKNNYTDLRSNVRTIKELHTSYAVSRNLGFSVGMYGTNTGSWRRWAKWKTHLHQTIITLSTEPLQGIFMQMYVNMYSTFPMQLILAVVWDSEKPLQHIYVPQWDCQDILILPVWIKQIIIYIWN